MPVNDPNYELLQEASDIRHSCDTALNQYTYQFTSENYVDFNSNVDTVVSEWKTAFLSGEKDVDADWDAYIAALNDAGYSKIEDDLNAWMAEHE